MQQPDKETIKAARLRAGQTQKEAAAVIHKELLAWQRYEYGLRKMDLAYWELYLIKTGMTDLL